MYAGHKVFINNRRDDMAPWLVDSTSLQAAAPVVAPDEKIVSGHRGAV
jgi:hypothetical protein